MDGNWDSHLLQDVSLLEACLQHLCFLVSHSSLPAVWTPLRGGVKVSVKRRWELSLIDLAGWRWF
jgi:hypothetical protein